MEAAPLTMAHAHASKAVHQMSLRNYKLASQEHQEAAEEFGKAVGDTHDPEALRTLMLLQNHHSLLSSKILKSSYQTPPTPPPQQTTIPGRSQSEDTALKPPSSMISPPTSPAHRPPALNNDLRPPLAVNMILQPPTPTTPSTTENPTHPSGTKKIPPPPMPLPSPTMNVQTLTLPPRSSALPSPMLPSLVTELANARGIRSPVRGRSPVDSKNYLRVQEPEPGARRSSSGGTFRSTSPVTLGMVPKKKRGSSGSGLSPVVGPREKLALAGTSNLDTIKDNEMADNIMNRGRQDDRIIQIGNKSNSPPVRPSVLEFENSSARASSPQPPSESSSDPFNRFYAQLETLISTVSNPLAFAGLPLNTDQVTDGDPDLVRVMNERAKANAESFYVVPPTGGTLSYADMVQRNDVLYAATNTTKHIVDDDEPPTASNAKSVNSKTREELEFENQQLRQMTDSLAKQLHVWESTAKENANRMRESLRLFKENAVIDAVPVSTKQARFGGTKSKDLPFRDAEELAKLKVVHEKTLKENEKLKSVVAKYRERWEKLKEGARSRRAASPDVSLTTTTTTTTSAKS